MAKEAGAQHAGTEGGGMPEMSLWQLGEGKHRAHRQGQLQGKDRHEEAGLSAEMSIVEMSTEREEPRVTRGQSTTSENLGATGLSGNSFCLSTVNWNATLITTSKRKA